jgi:hypothetical protein
MVDSQDGIESVADSLQAHAEEDKSNLNVKRFF